MRRSKAEAEKTREAIITAAIEVFLERGVSRATLDEIARAAGVTRGAIIGISAISWRSSSPWSGGRTFRTRSSVSA